MVFTEVELDYLRSPGRLGRLATARPDGTLQVNPVGVHVNSALGAIDIGGRDMAASRKFKNVGANGRVALVVDDIVSLDPWRVRCIEVRGVGEAILAPTDSAVAWGPGPIIRIHARRIISWGVDPEAPARRTIDAR
jgi:pyridoxamine 5'-phosphate oxidase family protein